ncbi:hypothetical protein HYH02_000074 [Chlamydomonas schloesseri]|uniref:Jacalin-type lectin domain-containing protein n=1 Tax=Chlamydomonas schloesseri TaxID=2026947 RepID=A0A835WNM9_9CHLO|nr:hypothetical protein HYH02_000074 [Chlamydomonas schloesseri]|eukprot:KAG2449970.1 hypothetical protein HYH02_000074 [Chlamydomonas schloesseri]
MQQGPYGLGGSGATAAFDDGAWSSGGANPLSEITVMSGSWIDSIQVRYGDSWAPRRGGTGGSLKTSLLLSPGESIAWISIRYGAYVDGMTVRTNTGRQQILGTTGVPNSAVATPCASSGQPRLLYITGVAASYLESLTFVWTTAPAMPQPSPPPPPLSPVTISAPEILVIGTFGGGNDAAFVQEEHVASSGAPGPRLTGIRVLSGSWIDAIQFQFGGLWGPQLGGLGGGVVSELLLAVGEVIISASVVSGAYVDALILTTSFNRTVALGPGRTPAVLAAPCPPGSYRLVGVRGTAGTYLSQVSLVWRPRGSAAAAAQAAAAAEAAARAAGWRCEYGLNSVIRAQTSAGAGGSSNLQPQCLTLAGQTSCLQGGCGSGLLRCAASASPGGTAQFSTAQCSGSYSGSDWSDPSQWCPRATGLLGLPTPRPPTPIRLAVINLDVCDTGPAMQQADVDRSLFDDPYGLQPYWGAVSRGRAYFNRSTAYMRTIKLPCSVFKGNECKFNDWVNYVDNRAAELGLTGWATYSQRRMWLVPRATGCQDIGFSAGNNVYVRGDIGAGQNDYLNVFKHELGHSLGLGHSGRGTNSYGESSDPLGYCQRCSYNAPHLLQMGWISATSTLTSQQLPVGVVSGKPWLLPALADVKASPAAALVIWPDWILDSEASGGMAKYGAIVISYRTPIGQDFGLPDEYSGYVHVHRVPALAAGADTWLEELVAPGASAVVEAARLVVRVDIEVLGNVGSGAATAQVRVCRYATSASECGVQ